jgi:hypothetical protein
MNPMNSIIQFATGKMSVEKFSALIHEALETKNDLEKLLRDPAISWRDSYIGDYGDILDYLIQLDYSRLGGIVDAIGAISDFLKKKNLEVQADQSYRDLYRLLLDSSPTYCSYDSPDLNSDFFKNEIAPIVNQEITNAEKKKQIREKLKSCFKYQTKPPRWIQGDNWLMSGDKPLFFVGQMPLKHEAFHDDGAVYIFLNPETGEIKTVTQFY